MSKNKEIDKINEELAKREHGVPAWIFVLIIAFIIGFVFRYTIADAIRGNSNKKENDNNMIVWKEPYTIDFEEDNPGKLGDKLSDRGILLDGTYYHLPCPIYRFVENGWVVDIAGNNYKEIVSVVPKDLTKVVSMTKDGKTIKVVSVASPIDEDVSISESFVTGLSIFSWSDIEIELPKKIKIGSTKTEIEKIIKEEKLSYDEDKLKNDNVYDIIIEEDDDLYEDYEIKFNLKKNKVDQIRVEVYYKK